MSGEKSNLIRITEDEFFIIEETKEGTIANHYKISKNKYKLLQENLINIKETSCDYLWIVSSEDEKEQLYNSKLRRKGKYSVSKIGKFFDFGGAKMALFEDQIGDITLASYMDETGDMPLSIENRTTGEQISTDTIYFNYESTRNKIIKEQYSDKRAKHITM
ncbi:MAG: hypothetical protein PHQ64_01885 [Bacilli bacterium]|nr:hypothetical protein [Bacilli bacterium]